MFETHILPLIVLLTGLGLLAAAWVSHGRTVRFLQQAMETAGKVVELRPVRDEGTTWLPVVEFTAPSGERVRFESHMSRNPPAYKTGDRVAVLYDPQDVKEARIKSFGALWLSPLLLGIMGIAFTSIGAALLVGIIRLQPSP